MPPIQLDEKTAARLAAMALQCGMTVEAYLRLVVAGENPMAKTESTAHDFDAELDALLFDGPSLPADFSRADIYADHD